MLRCAFDSHSHEPWWKINVKRNQNRAVQYRWCVKPYWGADMLQKEKLLGMPEQEHCARWRYEYWECAHCHQMTLPLQRQKGGKVHQLILMHTN